MHMNDRQTAEQLQRQFTEDAINASALKTSMRELEKRMDQISPAQIPATEALYHQAAHKLDDIRERAITSAVGLASVLPQAEESQRIASKLGYDSVEAFLENNQDVVFSESIQTIIDAKPNSLENMFEQQQELPETNSITK